MLRRLTWQKHSGRDPSLPLIALVLALVVLGAASAVIPQLAPTWPPPATRIRALSSTLSST